MKNRFFRAVVVPGLLLLVGVVDVAVCRASIWINEFHYDNSGGDVGEFVEVVVGPDMSGVNLGDVRVSLYNGSNGEFYNSAFLSAFDVGDLINGFQFYSLLIAGIQNGPDGLALDNSGSLIEFLSYEGSFAATNGPAVGVTSVDIGVAESTSAPIDSSLGLTGGPGSMAGDFTWTSFNSPPGSGATRGTANVGQSFSSGPGTGGMVPTPTSAVIWLMLIVAVAATRRMRVVPNVGSSER